MGEVVYHDFAHLQARQRDEELKDARRLAEEFPDLANAAYDMVELLARFQGLFYLHGNAIPAAFNAVIAETAALLDWLDERTPT